MPDKREWTYEWPTEPGWYWCCEFQVEYEEGVQPVIFPVQVYTYRGEELTYSSECGTMHKGDTRPLLWAKASIPDAPDPPEFDRDTLHDYVVEQGCGVPSEKAYRWARREIQCFGRSYSQVAHDIVGMDALESPENEEND